MLRTLFAVLCLLSLLVGSAAAVVTAHSRRACLVVQAFQPAW